MIVENLRKPKIEQKRPGDFLLRQKPKNFVLSRSMKNKCNTLSKNKENKKLRRFQVKQVEEIRKTLGDEKFELYCTKFPKRY